ncbi:MAG: hypothetical protein H6698_01045 [Myxococcales bacterium]|nr:hypothetical protein [Myxococcales bacterium]MCB9530977.1 hypothetical protein [Myxococcales bacterium]MCB9532897.1 hypothetical protein [Myxococcales bacterium]
MTLLAAVASALAVAAGPLPGPAGPPDVLGAPSAESLSRVALTPNLAFGECSLGGVSVVLSRSGSAEVSDTVTGQQTFAVTLQAFGRDDGYMCSVGYYERPHVCVRVVDPVNVTLTVTNSGGYDTTIAVAGPNGFIDYDDDSAGDLRPMLATQLEPGEYLVFVGTYSSGTTAPFSLTLSASDGVQ